MPRVFIPVSRAMDFLVQYDDCIEKLKKRAKIWARNPGPEYYTWWLEWHTLISPKYIQLCNLELSAGRTAPAVSSRLKAYSDTLSALPLEVREQWEMYVESTKRPGNVTQRFVPPVAGGHSG